MSRGEAGRAGEGVRSDLLVRFEERASGGIELALRSKVEPYYGDAIRTQVRTELESMGIRDALVEIEDQGALPFAITARLRAAVSCAGIELDPVAAPAEWGRFEPTARGRLRRSRLYIPGNEPKFMLNAGLYGSDGLILDLEDSVHRDAKESARHLVSAALRHLDFGGAERMVRINQLPLGLEDLEETVPAEPDLILIPKVECADQVREVDRRIDALLEALGSDRPLWLMPILESALGVENAFDIATSSERVVALTIGLEDYTADLGVVKTVEGGESLFARSRLVNAARAAGCQAIDSVFGDVGDMDGLRSWARRSRALGFEGMGCIHPRQIEVIHAAFAPSQEEIDKALCIVQAFERAQAAGLGVVSLGSKMIDPPVVNRALKLVELARAMGLVAETGGEA